MPRALRKRSCPAFRFLPVDCPECGQHTYRRYVCGKTSFKMCSNCRYWRPRIKF
jgi:hypothetical protein